MLMLMLAQNFDDAPSPTGKTNWEMARDSFFSVPVRFAVAAAGAVLVWFMMKRSRFLLKLFSGFGAAVVAYILHGLAWMAINRILDRRDDIPYQISLGRVVGLVLYPWSWVVVILALAIGYGVYIRQGNEGPAFVRKLTFFGTTAGIISVYMFVANNFLE